MQKFKRVMIIDDDRTNNIICESVIMAKKIAESVKSFLSVAGSLSYLRATKNLPDVLFLDINFGGEQDGWYFLEEYKKLMKEQEHKTLIYVLSSSIAQKDIDKANNDVEVSKFISKPLTPTKIEKLFA